MTLADLGMGLVITVLMVACHPELSPLPPEPPEPHVASEPASVGSPGRPLGSQDDLRARGAFRAEDGNGASSEIDECWLTVSIQTQSTDRTWWAMAAGGQLRSEEILVVNVELHRPAHIYIIDVDASGRSTLLYPDTRYERDSTLGLGTHRLPPQRSELPYIELDTEVGLERLYIIATADPIEVADGNLGKIVKRLQRGESPIMATKRAHTTRSKATRSDSRSATDTTQRRTRAQIDEALFDANAAAIPELRSRGGHRSRSDGAAIDAKAGDDGVVVVPFEFEHI